MSPCVLAQDCSALVDLVLGQVQTVDNKRMNVLLRA